MSPDLTTLEAGMVIPYGGNRFAVVDADLARAFKSGDRIVVVQDTGAILHLPSADHETARTAVHRAHDAFARLALAETTQIDGFYHEFADRLADDSTFEAIASANRADVRAAAQRGRSTTRLALSPTMRADMIDGLRGWAKTPDLRGKTTESITHHGWQLDLVRAGLGVVGFVFEGRPNVFADAAGLLRSGNTVVFRIGSDALGTARAIVSVALEPALQTAGLPQGAISLVDSPSRAAGWALFSDSRLALAVARGSGAAVSQLGAVARQAGIAVSLHGTGGAWIVSGTDVDADAFHSSIYHSLDRKVCNTLNTCCIPRRAAAKLVPSFLDALRRSADDRSVDPKLHVVGDAADLIPSSWFELGNIGRAEGTSREPMCEPIPLHRLGDEWEWEESPEVTLTLVNDLDEAIELFNTYSPHFAASLVSNDPAEHDHFFATVDAPFVGNGFTRWVDGQYALERPELGLSNWEFGRLFGRSGILSGESVFTVRARAHQIDPDIGR